MFKGCHDMINNCSRITYGRVLNGKLYAQRLKELLFCILFTGCFMKQSNDEVELHIKHNIHIYQASRPVSDLFIKIIPSLGVQSQPIEGFDTPTPPMLKMELHVKKLI